MISATSSSRRRWWGEKGSTGTATTRYGQMLASRMMADMIQGIEAVQNGHFQIEKHGVVIAGLKEVHGFASVGGQVY